MPVDMSRYPKNWKRISSSIRKRSGGVCECHGECGKHSGRCDAINYEPHPLTGSKVVLTVAHLGIKKRDGSSGDKHDKKDVRRRNLKAMCQRCHLCFDMDEHKANARRTRLRKKIEAGQLVML